MSSSALCRTIPKKTYMVMVSVGTQQPVNNDGSGEKEKLSSAHMTRLDDFSSILLSISDRT